MDKRTRSSLVFAGMLALGCVASTGNAAPAKKKAPSRPPAPAKKKPAAPAPLALPVEPPPTPLSPTDPRRNPPAPGLTDLREYPLAEAIQPLESGPGLIVCEPVAPAGDPKLAEFGSGCGRWLHLFAAGQGEFGRTPSWVMLGDPWQRLGKTRMGSLDEAAKIARIKDATHVALGDLRSANGKLTLTYRLWEVATRKALGEPVSLSGTEEELRAGLPSLARQLAIRLGAPQPMVPERVGETVEELRLLGRLPWTPNGNPLRPEDAAQLEKMVAESVEPGPSRQAPPILGAFYLLMERSVVYDRPRITQLITQLTPVLPENTLLLADLGMLARYYGKWEDLHLPIARLQALLKRFPNSSTLNTGAAYYYRVAGTHREGRLAATKAVRASLQSSDAWGVLSDEIKAMALSVRRGRYFNVMTPAEQAFCIACYDEQLKACRRSVRLDPENLGSWMALSVAATFAGEDDEADRSLWVVLKRAPGDYQALWWGTQIYQPKWFDQPEKLKQVLKLALTSAEKLTPNGRLSLAYSAHGFAPPELVTRLLRTPEEREAFKRATQSAERNSEQP